MERKQLKYIILLVVFVIALDFGFGHIYEFLYLTEKSQKQDRLIHSAIGTHEEVLVFGSSRACHHYNPEIIEEKLNLTCFNVGYGGQNIYYHLALLKEAIKRKKPQIAILDLIKIDFEDTGKIHDKEKLSVLLPFVNKSNIYRETVLLRGKNEKIKLFSSIYPFNSKLLHILRNNLTSQRSDTKGFFGLSRVWGKPIETKMNKNFTPSNDKLEALGEFITLCQTNEIMIKIFISPHYAKFSSKNGYDYIAEYIQKNHGLEINNLSASKKYLNAPHLFSDPYHLNKQGADMYSKEISEIIKKQLLN
jgi:hypothetical protein